MRSRYFTVPSLASCRRSILRCSNIKLLFQLCQQGLGLVGHGRKFGDQLLVHPVEDLLGPEARLTHGLERSGKLGQRQRKRYSVFVPWYSPMNQYEPDGGFIAFSAWRRGKIRPSRCGWAPRAPRVPPLSFRQGTPQQALPHKLRVPRRNARHLQLIFFRLDGAGRVDHPPAGLEQPAAVSRMDAGWPIIQPGVLFPASYSGYPAFLPEYPGRCRAHPPECGRPAGRAGFVCVASLHRVFTLVNPIRSTAVRMSCTRFSATSQLYSVPGILHFLGQQQGLAAGCGTQVDHGIAGFCLHTEGCQLAGLPLHMEISLLEEFLVRGAALKSCQHTAGHYALPHSRHQCSELFRTAQRRPL